jgi:hypothetical protein
MGMDEAKLGAELRKVLEPFAASFSGSLARGDLVIPQTEVDRVVGEILRAARSASEERDEVSTHDLFQFLVQIQRLGSVQEQADRLRTRFRIQNRA